MKKQIHHTWLHFPKGHLVATSCLSLCFTVTLFIWPSEKADALRHSASTDTPQLEREVYPASTPTANAQPMIGAADPVAAPDTVPAQTIASLSEPNTPSVVPVTAPITSEIQPEPSPVSDWATATVRSGDNLSTIFSRFGLSGQEVYRFVAGHENAKALTRLQPGETLQLLVEDQQLKALKYAPNALDTQTFERLEKGFSYDLHSKVPEVRQTYREATIDSSLFLAAAKVGMDDALIMELANIFGWDIDFVLDIRQGDRFRVVFEEEFLDGEKFANGNILAAEFVNKGKPYQAVRYTDTNGYSQYFTPDGQSMRKEFLRTPVDFARISSHFNLRRKHPVLNTIRAHKGTDYAAPTGTPIKAVGDGKVIFAGRKGGYGNVVQIQHGQTYQTLYAHMSKFRRGIKKGATVKQGQVIGYVGSTGLATGPHLHYEFYVNGAVRNPVTVKLPKAQSIASSEMVRFSQQTQPLLASLGAGTTQLAMKDPESSGE